MIALEVVEAQKQWPMGQSLVVELVIYLKNRSILPGWGMSISWFWRGHVHTMKKCKLEYPIFHFRIRLGNGSTVLRCSPFFFNHPATFHVCRFRDGSNISTYLRVSSCIAQHHTTVHVMREVWVPLPDIIGKSYVRSPPDYLQPGSLYNVSVTFWVGETWLLTWCPQMGSDLIQTCKRE